MFRNYAARLDVSLLEGRHLVRRVGEEGIVTV